MLKQARGHRGHVVGVSPFAPELDLAAHLVDEPVGLDAVGRPLGVEDELLLTPPLSAGPGNGHETGAGATLGDDHLGDALVVEVEMSLGFLERRVDDRVLDDDLPHEDEPSKILPGMASL
ncbi:MAG: hypothetical protein NUV77_11050 [Thermoguttaceae bacterium]|jgi:hypothetical protein|nr:hypothetical protein [Thermoguttaceae bacterium]